MTEPSEEMKAMARRIADEHADDDGLPCNSSIVNAALAAIIETQRADAELVESRTGPNWPHAAQAQADRRDIAEAIRTGNHYGKDESHD